MRRAALERFLACVLAGDVAGVEAMLADEVHAISDAGGEFPAARVPVRGRKNVAALCLGVARGLGGLRRSDLLSLNALPALVAEADTRPGFASRWVMQADLDDDGRIVRLYTVLASRKLTAVPARPSPSG